MKTLSDRNQRFIAPYVPRELPFRELPLEAQMAVAQYFGVDGEAWPEPVYPVTREQLPGLVKTYGDVVFGYVEVPLDALTAEVMEDDDLKDAFGSDFEAYHSWYMNDAGPKFSPGKKGKYKSDRWPVFLSCYDDETLQDGWHRFHCYYARGVTLVPCLYSVT